MISRTWHAVIASRFSATQPSVGSARATVRTSSTRATGRTRCCCANAFGTSAARLRSMENRSRSTNATSSCVHSASLSISSLTKPSCSSASPSRSPVRRWWSTPSWSCVSLITFVSTRMSPSRYFLWYRCSTASRSAGERAPCSTRSCPTGVPSGLASCARRARVSCPSVTSPSRSRSSPSRRVRGGRRRDATRLGQRRQRDRLVAVAVASVEVRRRHVLPPQPFRRSVTASISRTIVA